ncbi:anhydro-N-acetylmuramic acid kinase [Sphingobacterium suaedae]|uniref:Anhydro-N-acetylmuramic acid kinase n=1 Tax=Sphingobacterium suaedae TaxID=1686402 RepID=A0ABW5KFE1_9SPHI
MNPQIEKLYHIARKTERKVIGLMSGTSLDGLDVALCSIGGSGIDTRLRLEKFVTVPYPDLFRDRVREIFAKRQIDQQDLCGLNAFIGSVHGDLVANTLGVWQIAPSEIDLIASHGQTVYHAPQRLTKDLKYPNSTLQLGDGDHIASRSGIITLSDFRQKHIAAGGEGAPLAAYGDYLLFTHDREQRFLLNIGGISNFTFLPKKGTALQPYATDLGPGNTMMNQYMHKHFGLEMDEGARCARAGHIHPDLLTALLHEPFLTDNFPKTTGPELFNLAYLERAQALTNTASISPEDVMATLNKFAASAIVEGIKRASKGMQGLCVYVSGGGLHNPLLMEHIRHDLQTVPVRSFTELGLNPDAKEACLFALLANETVAGGPEHVSSLKDSPAVCMGKISFPY